MAVCGRMLKTPSPVLPVAINGLHAVLQRMNQLAG